jgi:hypothetical protein
VQDAGGGVVVYNGKNINRRVLRPESPYYFMKWLRPFKALPSTNGKTWAWEELSE